ncbi:MAG TPA: hypothetical protein VJH04_01685 [archaeon]|nr:hypothetical protein [archaeon]
MTETKLAKKIMEDFEEYCKKNGISGKQREEKLAVLMKAIEKYKYEPGEAIGVIAAQSISEPATQMCTSYDEKVIVRFENTIKTVTIGEFVDSAVEELHEKIDGYEIFDMPENVKIFVPSLSPDKNMEWKRISALCRHKSPDFLLEVKTRSDRSVKATEYHSFVVEKEGKIVPIAGKDLKVGDKIPAINISEILTRNNNSVLVLIKNSVVLDEIIEINKIEPSSDYVYDMTIEDNHTFTTSDGLIIHNTMRSYTMASQSDRLSKVTHGLPRLIEIFDARKTFEKNMFIYLKDGYNTKEKAKEIAGKIKSMKMSDIITYDSIDLVNMQIEFELERESYKDEVKELLEKHAKDCDITTRGKNIYIKPKKDNVKNLRKIKNKLLKLHTQGVKGIENVVVIKEGEDWIIQTTGTNLKKILHVDGIDMSRTKTNDIHQIYDVLGVEAARNVILQESKDTLDEQGLDVDVRHLMLLADMMTFDGTIKDIGRYGVSGKKASVLARANFEETKKHIVNASFYGEKDKLEGIIENILIGQIAPIGTGMVELAVDMEKMKKGLKKAE